MKYSEAFTLLRNSASEQDIAALLSRVGDLPAAYVEFLRATDGVEGAIDQPEGGEVHLYSVSESLDCNTAYGIQESLPALWMIGDDGGDYAFCFDRAASPLPDNWLVVEAPLGALFADDLFTVATSFSDWQERLFEVRHSCDDPSLPESLSSQEAWLVLDAVGPSPVDVARIIRSAVGGTSQAALELIRSTQPTILRSPAWQQWRLKRLHAQLTQHGALATIHYSP